MSRIGADGTNISEHTVKVGERNVHYWSAGEGVGLPLILVHGGFGAAWGNWNAVIGTLARSFHVIAPDLPGYGQSDPLHKTTASALTAWLAAFMDAIGQPQAALVGHSFGGLIVRLLAAEAPDRAPAVVLVNGGVIPKIPPITRLVSQTPVIGGVLFGRIAKNTSSYSALNRIVYGDEFPLSEAFVAEVSDNQKALSQLLKGLAVSTISPDRRTPLVPVLLVWGEEDSVSPMKTAEYIQGNIPGAELNPIADCGHFPHLEVSDVFSAQVELFLNRINRARTG